MDYTEYSGDEKPSPSALLTTSASPPTTRPSDKFQRTGCHAVRSSHDNTLIFDQFQNGYYITDEQVGRAWNVGAALAKAK